MTMFTNYQDNRNYIPNNLLCSCSVGKSYTKLDPLKASKPYEEYNAKGELVGYSWYQGETINLEFNIDGEIIVETDALKYFAHEEQPSSTTIGKVGQKAYNVVDLRSWICVSADNITNKYSWSEIEFEHDSADAAESVYVSAADYLADKQLELRLLNFRYEPIYTSLFDGNSKLIFTIDTELANKLQKGIYYCSLTVISDTVRTTIFDSTDCVLLIK